MPATSITTEAIRKLNDALRSTFMGGRIMMTPGVTALPYRTKAAVLTAVRNFSDFTPENDPHQEHDFGAFVLDGEKFFFKIDYYNNTLDGGSENPADPKATTRVLTIMLSSEY